MKAGQGVRSSIVGRGAAGNPKNRFEKIEVEPEPRGSDADEPGPETVYLRDASRSIIAQNDSPDLGFDISINPYRDAVMGAFTATLVRHTSTWGSQPAWSSRARSW